MKVRILAHGGMLTALLALGLLLMNILPTGQTAGLVMLSLVPGIYLRRGYRGMVALACGASVLLAGLMGLQTGLLCLYASYFAWYALLWVATEGRALGRIWRLAAAQGSIAMAILLWRLLGGSPQGMLWQILAAEVAVILYDFAFGFCVRFYDAHFKATVERVLRL